MSRSSLLVLLLVCACTDRTSSDEDVGDDSDSSSEDTTTGTDSTSTSNASNVSVDDSSGPSTATATFTTTSSTTDEPPPTMGFDADIQPIFDEHCVTGCHEPGGQWGAFLDLSPGTAYAAIVGVPSPQFIDLSLIEPGEPDASYLWHKINGTQIQIGGSGLMMPSAQPGMRATVIRPEQFAAIEAWILQGAPQ